ncbi:Membrane-bound lytic murein transglycosylase B [Micromonospora coxensis]|uniref:Membrane-bound lytic murein transglycosylase B n=1 Tax=Micromonospora coxensis TaxID=356852 RepID=A0A1C5IEF8_9ACTN|nr:Membrane-bound lytic murein transglycosylase B [Micromonospora coxensis]
MRPLRPATPPDGPLGSSGAAPDPAPLPRPRRPVPDEATPATSPAPDGPAAVDRPVGTDAPTTGRTGAGSAAPAAAAEVDGAVATGAKATDPKADATKADAATPDATRPGDAKADGTKADGAKADGAKAGPPEGEPAKSEPAKSEAAKSEAATADAAKGVPGRRRRIPFAHAVRLPPPRQAVAGAARATRAWSRRPSGRLTLPGLFLFALVAATGAVGAVVVPSAVRQARPVAVDATEPGPVVVPAPGALPGATVAPVPPGVTPPAGLPPVTPLPGGATPTTPAAGPVTGRPADALAAWARTTGAKVGVSPVAMQAYGYAELVLAETNRSCQLSWTTLAAIGYVESRHGQANGARLGSTGRAEPEIIGDPLDGNGGRMLIRDTDRGLFDRDTTYDRAIGPMQFIPTTWQEIGADADNDGRKDPHDLDDAALAAGKYLCKGGRNMTVPGDWWGAILSYNDVRRYATDVYDKANEYGRASRT